MLISQILLVLMLVITQQMLLIQISLVNKLVIAQQVLLIQISLVLMLVKTTGAKFSNFVINAGINATGAESSNFFGQNVVI
jgi:hypothetical protein